jgi:hypothetical protein
MNDKCKRESETTVPLSLSAESEAILVGFADGWEARLSAIPSKYLVKP